MKTVERRLVSGAVVVVEQEAFDVEGKPVVSFVSAMRGEHVTLTLKEQARLDHLGMLAPVGQTIEDVERHAELVRQAYVQARQSAVSSPSGFEGA